MSELLSLSTEIEDDPSGVDDLQVGDKDDEGGDSKDNEERLEDEHQDLSAEQIAELEADLIPVCLMLTKV